MAYILSGMPRTGRPRIDNPRSEILRVRLTADERDMLAAAADRAGQSLTAWTRARLIIAAKRQR